MIQIDFSKAFDSNSFEFIQNIWKLFIFNNSTITWILTLLNRFASVFMINGFPTPRINVDRGCRQGDPIAGYLFILCVEILLLKISSLENITPCTSNSCTKKIIDAYAPWLQLKSHVNYLTLIWSKI